MVQASNDTKTSWHFNHVRPGDINLTFYGWSWEMTQLNEIFMNKIMKKDATHVLQIKMIYIRIFWNAGWNYRKEMGEKKYFKLTTTYTY